MALFGKRDQYSDAPKFVVRTDTGETGQEQFGNTVFGVDTAEVGVTQAAGHTGWVKITAGSGGRNGRTQYEVLVAGGITGDATDFANTSTSDVANTSGTADDTTFADS
jgi:hypothetical protein